MVGPVDVVMDGDKARRTSSYLPEPARERARGRKQGGDAMADDRRVEVRRSKSVPPVASESARPRRVSLVLDEPRSKPPTAKLPMLRKPVATAPRFSPFPATGSGAPDQRRLKGLGQGSARRLDKEVARWVEGVQAEPRTSSDAPPSIISDVSTDILDTETTGPGRRGGSRRLSREGSMSERRRRIAQNF